MLVSLCLATIANKYQQKLPFLPTINLDYIENNEATTKENQKKRAETQTATDTKTVEVIIDANSLEEKDSCCSKITKSVSFCLVRRSSACLSTSKEGLDAST